MKISSIKVNGAAIEDGGWVRDIPQLPGVSLRVRGRNCTAARRLQAKLLREVPRERRLDGIDPSDEDAIEAKVLADVILLGWEGIENDAGEPLEFSAAQAAGLMEDPDFVVFRAGVSYAAMMVAASKAEDAKADAGN